VVALAIYNAGVLGRLQAEVLENSDRRPADLLRASGATATGALTMATVPAVSSRFAALGLYRWEVAIRETVIVGVVGAAGLGRRLDQQTSAFDYDGILATIVALLVVTIVVDISSAAIRRSLR
jgi:phosphonate transport system permease protein